MESFHGDLLTRSLNFHGQQLQKIWEAERGEADLVRHSIKDLDFLVYAQRQKHLSFQDRGKRLKLHQFITKKSDMLFSQSALDNIPQCETLATEDIYAIMPPFETFLSVDKQNRLRYFFENVKIGDLMLGTIVSKTTSGMMLKVLCTINKGSTVRYVADINVKAFCPVGNVIAAVDRKGVSRSYMMNDSVCCEVLEVIPDTDKMVCGMKGSTRQPGDPDPRPALGLITAEDFPLEYKKALDNKGENYDSVLEKSVGFNNPNNISYLTKQMAIATDHCSLMSGLKGRFPEQEYAIELRQVQASKWAFRSVADGIDHFKAGRHTEAFQCLNKALTIDPKNVEGLVARGALYANSGNFQKAIEDFETALKLNPSHANARKYMGETLVALGRSYEDENKLDEARKAYQSCLTIIPFHEEAQNSLDFLKNKANATKNLIEPAELMLPIVTANKPFDVKDNLMKQLMKTEDPEKKDKKKKKKSKKRKNRHHSSSSSSSSSSGSSHSSSSSSSSTTDSSTGSSDSEFKKRKKRRHRREKQRSLSPLSKRMAMMDPSHETPSNYQFNKPNASFQFGFEQPVEAPIVAALKNPEDTEYETKVRNFLEQTKGDSDYEDKVRKFLEETARWKKDKKSYDKKKKKKRDKKAKKESKKKRKDKKLRHKDFDIHELEEQLESKKLRDALKKELGVKEKHKRRNMNMDVADYFLEKAGLLDNIPDLEDIESKLRDYYAMEKESKRSERSMSISPKRIIIDSPSPTREQKARQAVAEAAASASTSTSNKWKMQIGAVQGGSRFKKRPEREDWGDERRIDEEIKKPPLPPPEEKGISVRKAMALKEPLPKKDQPPEPPKFKPKQPPMNQKPMIIPGQVVLDKFGSFRLLSPTNSKKIHDDDLPPLPPGAPPKSAYPNRNSKPPEPPGRPRSGSRSPKRKSRSRSRGKYSRPSSRSSSASRSRGRSRSRSYRSRSRSYYSRSRSRSGSRSYYSRSRSRSRSYSGDRRRVHDRRGGFRGRYNDRGTYYKPRFQNYKNQRGYNRGRGGYNRDGRDFNRDYRDYRGGRGGGGNRFNYNNRGRRPRGRFRGSNSNYRDFRDRRYDRSRSRDNSRDRSVSRENDESTMKKVNEEKEKINKYLDNGDEPVRHEGPLSEGEDRDDYSSDKFVDRQSFDGKWAEKEKKEEAANKETAGGGLSSGGGEIKTETKTETKLNLPPESNIEEMDKFLTKAKKVKKEEMLERNKDMLKTKPW